MSPVPAGDDAARRTTADRLAEVTVGAPERLDAPVFLADYDPHWPQAYAGIASRIRAALGSRVATLEHVGSTSVPGLCAKPRIDVLLEVADPADEDDYVPALTAAGFALRIREPDWHEHRMLRGRSPDANVHVFATGSAEGRRMLAFRDRLRRDRGDRERYAAVKRALAGRTWAYVQDYADAKSGVVADILSGTT